MSAIDLLIDQLDEANKLLNPQGGMPKPQWGQSMTMPARVGQGQGREINVTIPLPIVEPIDPRIGDLWFDLDNGRICCWTHLALSGSRGWVTTSAIELGDSLAIGKEPTGLKPEETGLT